MVETNPYSAPRAQVRDPESAAGRPELATPWIRLGAVMLDALIPFSIVFVGAVFVVLFSGAEETSAFGAEETPAYAIVLLIAFSIVYFLFQLKLLAENGWTIGKKICGIRIIRANGDQAGVGRIFGLRMMAPGLLGAIPFVGIVFGLVDGLLIFSDQHRTLHDRMADTLVVVA